MPAEKWETVVNKKKGTAVTKSDVKKAQQKFMAGGDSIPKVEKKDPIQLEKTMFETGFKNEEEEKTKTMMADERQTVNQPSPRDQKIRKEKKKKVPKVFDVGEKLREIDITELKSQINDIKVKFPGNPLIWLKDATAWLKQQLIEAPSEKGDYAMINQERGFPRTEARSSLINVLKKLVTMADKKICNSLFVSLVASMVSEIQQNHGTIADRLMIQILCDVHPDIIMDNCNEVLQGKSKNADTYLAVMWAFSLPVGSLDTRFSVWWSSTFSVLDKKNHGIAGMFFLRNILNEIKEEKLTNPILTYDQMIQFIELMFNTKSSLQHTQSLMDEVFYFYPVLKRMLLTDNPSTQSVEVFEKVFVDLKNRDPSKERDLMCDILMECLTVDPACMEWWLKNCVHYMKESSALLKYIRENQSDFEQKVKKNRAYKGKRLVLNTAQQMLKKLEQANEKGKFEKKAGFKEYRRLCLSTIETERNRPQERSLFWTLLTSLFVFSAIFFVVDLYTSNGYKGSMTSHFLMNYEIDKQVLQTYGYVQNKTKIAYGYVAEKAPIYYAKVSPYVDPVLEKTTHYARIVYNVTYTHSKPVRVFLNANIPPILDKCAYFLHRQYEIVSTFIGAYCKEYAPILRDNVLSAYKWLQVSVPKACDSIVSALVQMKRAIYELNPNLFDSLTLHINNLTDYVIRTTPILMNHMQSQLNVCVTTTRNYISQGQSWLQQQMQSTTRK